MKTCWPDPHSIPGLSAHQADTAARALSGPVSILSGGPGTGKTYTFAAIVREVISGAGSHNVAVAAPTGKAAVRCTSAMHGHGLNGIEATTIHRLLGVSRNGYDGQGWGFEHNSSNPLPQKFVFIDEFSMTCTDTSSCLLDALQDGTHLLLIGDDKQLPPVGHGAPLRDLIAAGLPYGELTETHRNGGDIVRVCKQLNNGDPYQPSREVNIPAGHNVKHVEAHSPALAMQSLRRLIKTTPPGIDPVWDVQVLVAVNEKSEVGRKNVNKVLQEILNPNGEKAKGNPFRRDDKVICTSNSMLPLISPINGQVAVGDDGKTEIGEFIANGEIGQVVKVEPKLMHVAFSEPPRTVKVPLGKQGDADFQLGYAITTHKAQGSQAPIVITMIDSQGGANMVCSREWYCTALSRAERLTVTIGRKATVNKHCKRVSLDVRKTFLKELLEEAA